MKSVCETITTIQRDKVDVSSNTSMLIFYSVKVGVGNVVNHRMIRICPAIIEPSIRLGIK